MNPTTVFLLDDEPALLELLVDVVELVGLKPQGFTRASEFFAQVDRFPPGSILLLDLMMPEMDGIEVMRRLAPLENPPALILVSGTDIGVLRAAEKLGRAHNLPILASLTKPLSIESLQELLREQATGCGEMPVANPFATDQAITPEELRHAIGADQLTLYYQPQVVMATGRVAGAEALMRWNHPSHGLILPDRFIPLAEANDLMGPLTRWLIGEVVRQEREWRTHGLELPVSANTSAINITSLTLPEQLADLLADNRLDPTRLTLEITESALMGELVTSLDILTRLRLKGIRLSIDDFGTGYSSLSQLHRVPFTEMKIDRSFVAQMTDDTEARAIVKTCIILGHELNMKLVAEGVEDRATWDLLKGMGCDLAQGYFISRPLPSAELLDWVRDWGTRLL